MRSLPEFLGDLFETTARNINYQHASAQADRHNFVQEVDRTLEAFPERERAMIDLYCEAITHVDQRANWRHPASDQKYAAELEVIMHNRPDPRFTSANVLELVSRLAPDFLLKLKTKIKYTIEVEKEAEENLIIHKTGEIKMGRLTTWISEGLAALNSHFDQAVRTAQIENDKQHSEAQNIDAFIMALPPRDRDMLRVYQTAAQIVERDPGFMHMGSKDEEYADAVQFVLAAQGAPYSHAEVLDAVARMPADFMERLKVRIQTEAAQEKLARGINTGWVL